MKSARQHARDRGALGGADAQALEGALQITERERDESHAECERLREALRVAKLHMIGVCATLERAASMGVPMAASSCDLMRIVVNQLHEHPSSDPAHTEPLINPETHDCPVRTVRKCERDGCEFCCECGGRLRAPSDTEDASV